MSPTFSEAIIRILTSDSADFRELARIGGADPKSMYIGTIMDGADVRGQDLRGMKFTALDPSSLKRDNSTRFDDNSVEQPPAPAVFVPDERLAKDIGKRYADIAIFTDVDSYIEYLSLNHDVPAISVSLENIPPIVQFANQQISNRVISIVIRRLGARRKSIASASSTFGAVFYINIDESIPSKRSYISHTIRLISILSDYRDSVTKFAGRYLNFFSSYGEGRSPYLDAAAAIRDQMAVSDVAPDFVAVFGSLARNERGFGFHSAQELLHFPDYPVPDRKSSRIVSVVTEDHRQHDMALYVRDLTQAFNSISRNVSAHVDDSRYIRIEWRDGESLSLRLMSSVGQIRHYPVQFSTQNFVPNINPDAQVYLCPDASMQSMIHGLLSGEATILGAREFLQISGIAGRFSAISAQSIRILNGSVYKIDPRYVAMLLSALIKRSNLDLETYAFVDRYIHDSNLRSQLSVRARSFRRTEFGTQVSLRFLGRSDSPDAGDFPEIGLMVDQDGVSATTITYEYRL